MGREDSVGRIHKNTFIISASVSFGLAIVSLATRLFIRFHLRRERFAVDDACLLVAFVFLLFSFVILYQEVIDRIYLVFALQTGVEGIAPPADWQGLFHRFHLWSSICLATAWCAFVAVKLSFLFFFKRLIDRIHSWLIYWRVVTIFTLATSAYGLTVYFIGCPFFFDDREFQCSTGYRKRAILIESVAFMVVDTLGDLLILVIPIKIIWKIRVRLQQKIILTFSLCLTVIMIALSITRVCGLVYLGVIDSVWQTYWQFLHAEVGVFLAAAVAFRSFFVARNESFAPARYSVRGAFKQSLTGARKRRNPDSFPDSWYEIPGSELDTFSHDTENEQNNVRDRPCLSERDSKAERMSAPPSRSILNSRVVSQLPIDLDNAVFCITRV